MKRTLVLILLAFFGLTAAQAQKQVALLTHGDDVTVYYGANALVEANSAAVSGDIITLSSGTFSAPTITVGPLTVQGMGRYADIASNTLPTVISGEMNMSADSLTLKGMHLTQVLKQGTGTAHSKFVDCYFEKIDTTNTFSMSDCEFIQCNIKMANIPIIASVFTNCVVVGAFGENCLCNNCVMNSWNNGVVANNSIITYQTNSVNGGWVSIDNTNLSNCVGLAYDTYTNHRGIFNGFNSNVIAAGNYNTSINVFSGYSWADVPNPGWKYIYGETYKLTDTAAATFLGNDGTQIGVYGGQAPWGTRHVNYRITVPEQSNPNGTLEVNIEAVTEE